MIILVCDKKLEPAMLLRVDYIIQMLKDYIRNNRRTYQFFSKSEKGSCLKAVKIRMGKIVANTLPP